MALTKIKADGLTADLIDETKLADNSIDSEHYNDGSIDNAHLADDAVGVAELSATGTASSSTFLRGDNSWVTPTDTNTQLAFANDANNRVVTGDGSGGLNGEANLTFDGDLITGTHTSGNVGLELHATGSGIGNQTKYHNDHGEAYIGQAGDTTGNLIIHNSSNTAMLFATNNTERMRIHSNGAVTKPIQPIASLSHSGVIDVSNDELDSGNCYDTIRVNLGSHFDASTGRFTCPVAGTYRIFFGASINSESTNVRLRKNGATLNEAFSDDLNAVYNVSQEMIIDAAANDYLHLYVSGLKTMSGAQHKQITFELIA